MISTYTANPYNGEMNGMNFLTLPEPFAMKIIMSRKEGKQEENLQNVKKEYVIY